MITKSNLVLSNKKVYFASDFHLGIDADLTSTEREKKIVLWLSEISDDASSIYLVGDIFDYWFEYKRVVPKGYNRLFGKLAELRDKGINIFYFTGNHDMWMFKYMEEEFGIPIFRVGITHEIMGKRFFIAHGDGLGPGDYGYKFIKKIFNHPICQWLFARIHPNAGLFLMKYFSKKSRMISDEDSWSEQNEWLLKFSQDYIKEQNIDFLVFGHRHLPVDFLLSNNKTRYINLGDWLNYYSYGVFDGVDFSVQFYHSKNTKLITNNN